MEHLRELDDVAYVRFASVYRNFREAKDFEAVLGELSSDEEAAARHDAQMIFRILEDQFAQTIQTGQGRRPALHAARAGARPRAGWAAPGPIRPSARVVVKDGVIVGRGWTQPGGRPHAETEALARGRGGARRHALCHAGAVLASRQDAALRRCRDRGRHRPRRLGDRGSQSGSGRAGPCAGCAPPASRSTSGRAPRKRAHDHAGHFRRIRDRRPHVILKLAVSADGKIGAAGRRPVVITGEAAQDPRASAPRAERRDPGRHRHRAGGRSALTCRLPGMEARSPVRVVLDRALRIRRHQQAGAFGAAGAAMGDGFGNRRGAGGHEAWRGRRADDPRRHWPARASIRPWCCRRSRKGHHAADGGRRRAGGVFFRRRRSRRRSLAVARP